MGVNSVDAPRWDGNSTAIEGHPGPATGRKTSRPRWSKAWVIPKDPRRASESLNGTGFEKRVALWGRPSPARGDGYPPRI